MRLNFSLMIKLFLLLSYLGAVSSALEKKIDTVNDQRFVVVTVDLERDQLKQYWKNSTTNTPFGTFSSLAEFIKGQGQSLDFAMNSGIFAKEQTPLGLYIEEGKTLNPLNLVEPENPQGNFSIMPNGVLILEKNQAHVLTTKEYNRRKTEFSPVYATQSGPMLLIEGAYHPRFIKDSTSLKIRGGVCVKNPLVYFVVTETVINFYDFATYFKEQLQCNDALYLDGTLTQIYYEGEYFGAPFWKVREYVGMWGVAQ